MAKTHLLPLQVGFRVEPNTLKSRYQIVTKFRVIWCLAVYTGAIFYLLENERVSNRWVKKWKDILQFVQIVV